MSIRVEVIYATPQKQSLIQMNLEGSHTVLSAITKSGILQKHPEIDLEINQVGIFGKVCALDQPLRAADRIEIYRPLKADPKLQRKERAQLKKQ
jgi:putative ubiquitin-RnfH superfamily antitoxin RatB of RatAB toxin-antitoxin module